MFRLSQALLGSEHDPQRAADALDAATGVAENGFERLARRPGSRGGGNAAAPAPAGGAGGGVLSLRAPPRQQAPAGQVAAEHAAQQQQQLQQQQQQQSAARAGARQRRPYDVQPGGASTAEEVDSLVANARAAAARAQTALADLASPPRHTAASAARQPQHQQGSRGGVDSPPRAAAASPGAASSAPRPAAPLPYMQLTVSAADGAASSMTLPAQQQPVEVEAWVGHLRQHSEALIRQARGQRSGNGMPQQGRHEAVLCRSRRAAYSSPAPGLPFPQV